MVKGQEKKYVGLAGIGYWGKNILRNLHELGVLHTCCDTDSAILSNYHEKFPEVHFCSSLAQMLTTVLHFRRLFYRWHKNDKKVQNGGIFCHLIVFTKNSFFKGYPSVLKKAFVIILL